MLHRVLCPNEHANGIKKKISKEVSGSKLGSRDQSTEIHTSGPVYVLVLLPNLRRRQHLCPAEAEMMVSLGRRAELMIVVIGDQLLVVSGVRVWVCLLAASTSHIGTEASDVLVTAASNDLVEVSKQHTVLRYYRSAESAGV